MKNHCDRDFRIRNLLTWKNHYNRDFRIEFTDLKIVIFASIILFDFNQFALKIWKSSSWMIQKKHDLMISLFAVFSIENLISYNSQFSIWWLTTDWLTKKSNSSFFLFSIFLFHISNRWVVWKKMIEREKRYMIFYWWNKRDRIEYIKFRNFFRFFVFILFIIFNAQLNRTTISENIFDTIQLFMRRKL